jgi:hypothetical protein
LLSFTFTYGGTLGPQLVAQNGGSPIESFTVATDASGDLEYSINGAAFSNDWDPVAPGTQLLFANTATDCTITLATDGSTIGLGSSSGTVTSPASANLATFHVVAVPGNTANAYTIDDSLSSAASPPSVPYTINTGPGFITGPGINVDQSGSAPFAGGITLDGASGGDTYNVVSTFGNEPIALNGGGGDDTFNVMANAANTSLSIDGGGGAGNVVNVGSNPGTPSLSDVSAIDSPVNVTDPAGFTTLNILDAGDTTSGDATINTGSVTGLDFSPGGVVNYTGGAIPGVTNLNVETGTNGAFGITTTVTGTTAVTTLTTGPNADTVDVQATGAGAPLTIHGVNGLDTVNIGFLGDVSGILGDVTIDNTFSWTTINVDASGDTTAFNGNLSGFNPSTLTGIAPANIIYTTSDTAALNLTLGNAGASSNDLTIDFSTGNPLPTFDPIGFVYNSGFGFDNTLNLQGDLPGGLGGPGFNTETHNANDPTVFPQNGQYGSIAFADQNATASEMTYTGLTPINDTANATNYIFNDFADQQSFTAQDGPTVLGFNTIQFVNTPPPPFGPTFETTNIANKTNVTFNTTTTSGVNGVVNVTTPSTGLATLSFNMVTNGDNQANVVNTPPGVVTTVNGGTDEDTANVTGQGIPAGTTLFLNGNIGTNTLNYNGGGLTPTITAGALPGEIIISLPGFGSVDATNYQIVNFGTLAPVAITPGPAVSINSVEGFRYVDALVGTFTLPIPVMGAPPGFPASDFTATIDWGDPSPDLTAGTITQDASNPSVYDITGSHTFVDNGTFTVANTVAFSGGTVSTTLNGVTVQFTLPPSGPTAGTPATATVTQGPLAVTAFPVVGTEGIAIAAGPIATFIDGGGADPLRDYSASIVVTDSLGNAVVSVPAASINQNGDSAQFTVNSPGFTLPQEGTYQIAVTVTDDTSAVPITVTGASTAVIADADLTAVAVAPLAPNTGVALPAGTVVGSFTDANPMAPTSDFSAVIDWGDGSPNSLGTITQPGGVGTAFDVTGGHNYAKPGTYTTTINVVDDGGETVTLTGSATVTDLAVTGATRDFTTVEGQGTGVFVLATYTDPNTLATVANENATLAIGGWGDGTPTVAGITLTVQQIGVTPLTSPTNPGAPIFEVLGAHNYTQETPPGTPDTLSVIITTLGGTTTTLTSPPGGGVTVLDAKLTSSNGTEITGVEGTATAATTLLGTFADANQGSSNADFTTAPGSTVVNWGDGSAPETLAAANVTATGSADGIIYTVTAPHTYAEAGTYAFTVTVTDDGGAVTIISGSAIVADAALNTTGITQPIVSTTEAAIFPVPQFGKPVPLGPVGTFNDQNPAAPVSDFTATIDWGDGSPQSAGTITQPGGVGTAFTVSGAHTYADSGVNDSTPGTYPLTIYIVDDDGSRLTISNTVSVTDNAIALRGQLNPSSDSGLSNGVTNVTNINQPNFQGTSEPFSHVTLYATSTAPGSVPVPFGRVQADSAGFWSITSAFAAPDGTYNITATATDQFGVTMTPTPVIITSNLVIDTTDPVITSVFFNRLNGEIDYTILDPQPGSGVNMNSLLDSSNYEFTKVHANKSFPGKYIVTNITVTPGSAPGKEDVAVVFNNGAVIPGGFYLFTIRSASEAGGHGVQDQAENLLSGEFFGTFPTGGVSGTDFVAMLSGFHNKIFAPQTILGTANPDNGGVGGPPVGAVHSGNFTPVVPIGGGPVFGDPVYGRHHGHKKTTKAAKSHVVVKGQDVANRPKVVVDGNHPKGPKHS